MHLESEYQFTKISEGEYKMNFEIKHPIFTKDISYDTIRTFPNLTMGFIEHIEINSQLCTIIYKNIFEFIGLPKRYSHNILKKTVCDKTTIFLFEPDKSLPEFIPTESVSVVIDNTTIVCNNETGSAFFSIIIIVDLPDFIMFTIGKVCKQLIHAIKLNSIL